MDTATALNIQTRLFEAAAGEASFSDALAVVTEGFGGAGSVIFELNRRTGEIGDWNSPTLVMGTDAYDEHINAINPRMHYSLRHAPGHVNYEAKFTTADQMARSEFYDWLERFVGFRYFLGSRLYDDGDISVFHSVEFDRSKDHPDPDAIAAFGRIAHSVGNAWRLRRRHADADQWSGATPWTPDHLPWAIFALDESAGIVEFNRAGRAVLERGQLLGVRDGHLVALDAKAADRLKDGIAVAINGACVDVMIADGSGHPVPVQIIPVMGNIRRADRAVSALVYIRDPHQDPRQLGDILESLYSLTDAEQRLCDLLAEGVSLSDAAKRMNISRNTARNHLQHVFAKTGTRRQSELVARLNSLVRH